MFWLSECVYVCVFNASVSECVCVCIRGSAGQKCKSLHHRPFLFPFSLSLSLFLCPCHCNGKGALEKKYNSMKGWEAEGPRERGREGERECERESERGRDGEREREREGYLSYLIFPVIIH